MFDECRCAQVRAGTWSRCDVHGIARGGPVHVWVDLDVAHPRLPDAVRRVIGHGLDLTGRAPGVLHRWYQSAVGAWYGVVDYEISYIDGRRETYRALQQLVPAHALSLQGDPPEVPIPRNQETADWDRPGHA